MDLIAHVLRSVCVGPHPKCRAAHRDGRSVHVIPFRGPDVAASPTLVMPTCHYRTSADGIEAVMDAVATAPTADTPADRDRFREQGIPYFLR